MAPSAAAGVTMGPGAGEEDGADPGCPFPSLVSLLFAGDSLRSDPPSSSGLSRFKLGVDGASALPFLLAAD